MKSPLAIEKQPVAIERQPVEMTTGEDGLILAARVNRIEAKLDAIHEMLERIDRRHRHLD